MRFNPDTAYESAETALTSLLACLYTSYGTLCERVGELSDAHSDWKKGDYTRVVTRYDPSSLSSARHSPTTPATRESSSILLQSRAMAIQNDISNHRALLSELKKYNRGISPEDLIARMKSPLDRLASQCEEISNHLGTLPQGITRERKLGRQPRYDLYSNGTKPR